MPVASATNSSFASNYASTGTWNMCAKRPARQRTGFERAPDIGIRWPRLHQSTRDTASHFFIDYLPEVFTF
jgi:hypothetical protein